MTVTRKEAEPVLPDASAYPVLLSVTRLVVSSSWSGAMRKAFDTVAITGTVVIGNHVRVMPAAVSHGSLAVTISEKPRVSQPAPFSEGQTVVVPSTSIEVTQQGEGRMFLFESGVSLDDIAGEVEAVNLPGVGPDRYPAWQRRMSKSLEQLQVDPDVMAALGTRLLEERTVARR